jgi:purine-binding chemotaxis protein CheW
LIDLVVFEIGDRRLALPVSGIREIVRAVAVAPLPQAPPVVEGVVNVRGTVLPVVNVRPRFGLPPRGLSPDQHFILALAGPRLVALRVDRVSELVQADPQAIRPAHEAAPGSRHVAGVASLPDGVIVIQDLDQLLSLDEHASLDVALAEH